MVRHGECQGEQSSAASVEWQLHQMTPSPVAEASHSSHTKPHEYHCLPTSVSIFETEFEIVFFSECRFQHSIGSNGHLLRPGMRGEGRGGHSMAGTGLAPDPRKMKLLQIQMKAFTCYDGLTPGILD